MKLIYMKETIPRNPLFIEPDLRHVLVFVVRISNYRGRALSYFWLGGRTQARACIGPVEIPEYVSHVSSHVAWLQRLLFGYSSPIFPLKGLSKPKPLLFKV